MNPYNYTDEQIIERVEKYFDAIKDVPNIHRCYSIGNVNMGNNGKIIKVLDFLPYDGKVRLTLVVNTKSRAYGYDVPAGSRDEGWGIETGNFFNESSLVLPSFVFYPEFTCMTKEGTQAIVKEMMLVKQINDLEGSIVYQQKELKQNEEKLKQLKTELNKM